MSLVAVKLVSTVCAACGRPLTDAVSAELGIGPDCRAQFNYVHISAISGQDREEANKLIHAIAAAEMLGADLRKALFRVYELGFTDLAKRMEQRLWRRIAQTEIVEVVAPPVVVQKPKEPLPFKLTDGQSQGLDAADRLSKRQGYGTVVIAGYAGVGKTTLIRALAHQFGTPVVITPTGKAALRVREATGLSGSTIHRWLYKVAEDPRTGVMKFSRRDASEITFTTSRMVIVDEASMIGPDVWKDVHGACQQLGLKLVLIGDPFQLPPVQAQGAAPFSVLLPAFAEGINAERVEMTEVLRQAQDSPVIRASMELRNGGGLRALRELPKIDSTNFWMTGVATLQAGGVIVCHKNVSRHTINAGMRTAFSITDELPQPGEPMMVLKNEYGCGVVNGESFAFEGWKTVPTEHERIYDRYKQLEADTRFGASTLYGGKTVVTLSLEEIHGRLAEPSMKAIEISAQKWARLNGIFSGDTTAVHVHANFGYCWTAHKAQGSQWPYVFVCLEPSIRLDEEDGRRWLYTAVTRASQMTAIHYGRI